MHYQIQVASENSLIIYFGEQLGQSTNLEIAAQVQAVRERLQKNIGRFLIDLVPSYASLLVIFDPYAIDQYQLRHSIRVLVAELSSTESKANNLVELPVYYGAEVAEDLPRIAQSAKLSLEQVIDIHQQVQYRVFAIGFAPGFGYLGEVDERIAAPRLATPRSKVPKGAVAIADRQTAIYPAESPGGWNIIGRCPIPMFVPDSEPTMPFDVGDLVTFKAVSKQEFLALGGNL